MNTLIVGDIHGCWDELQALLDRAGPGADCQILSVGDMVNRGPDSPRVLDFFRDTPGAAAVRGNHEERHLQARRGEAKLGLGHSVARLQFGEKAYRDALRFMAELPLRRELPEARVVHAYWEPCRRPRRQDPAVLLGLPDALPMLWERHGRPWYELYDGDRPLVVGHLDYLQNGEPFVYADRVFALDTGCVRGGRLTGLRVPEFEFVSVKARRKHWRILREEYAAYRRYDVDAQADLDWRELERLLRKLDGLPALPAGLKERRKRLRKFGRRADRALARLQEEIERRAAAIRERLEAGAEFASLPADQRRRRFRREAGGGTKGRLLLLAYKERLSPRRLKREFKRPKALIRFAASLGLELGKTRR